MQGARCNNKSRLVSVCMMHVRHMRVPVPQTYMLVTVRMRLLRRIIGTMPVPVMGIVHMGMNVLHRLMLMIVFMHFSHMEPHAKAHQ